MRSLALRSARRLLLNRAPLVQAFHTSAYWASRKVLQRFRLADIGEGITECEVIKWSVEPLGSIQAFDPLCEVQSDKASVEITSPYDGIVKEILVQEGEVAKVGAVLCVIEAEDESIAESDESLDAAQRTDETKTNGLAPETSLSKAGPERGAPPTQDQIEKRRPHPLDPNRQQEVPSIDRVDVLATPSVRHFARQNRVDLAALAPGSGRGGRIEKNDIELYLSRSSGVETTLTPRISKDTSDAEVVVELGRTRYSMYKAMTKSLEIPHFGYSAYLDLTSVHNVLPLLNKHIPNHYLSELVKNPRLAVNPAALHPPPAPPVVPSSAQYDRLTFLPILLKTLSKAMMEWPLFRSSITPGTSSSDSPSSKPTLTIRPQTDITIGLSTPTGLYTPTLQRVNGESVYAIASQLKHLAHLGRQTPCGLTPAEMPKKGGTITVSNVGAIGAGEFASPVLVPGGGVAIVAIGRARWVRDEERDGEKRLRVGISWSADHRIVEGAELAAFVESWRGWIEHPERMIGEGI